MRGSAARGLAERARCAIGSGPAERGNISYHAPKRARSRSTQTRRAARRRSRAIDRHTRASRAASSSSSAAVDAFGDRRRVAERVGLRRAASAHRLPAPICSARPPPRERAATPSSSSSETSWPAAALILTIAPPGQEAIDPGDDLILVPADARRRRSDAVQSSVPGATRVIGVSRQPASTCDRRARGVRRDAALRSPRFRDLRSWRSRSTAATTSWPSAKMSAVTSTRSPSVRLIGKRPPSISGRDALDDDPPRECVGESVVGRGVDVDRRCRLSAIDCSTDCRRPSTRAVLVRLRPPPASGRGVCRRRRRGAVRAAAASILNTATERPCSG